MFCENSPSEKVLKSPKEGLRSTSDLNFSVERNTTRLKLLESGRLNWERTTHQYSLFTQLGTLNYITDRILS